MASWIAKTNSITLWRARLFLAGALMLAGVAPAQTIDDERRILAEAKAQSAASDARAGRLEAKAAIERGEAEKARGEADAVAARIQSAEQEIDAAEARIRLIEQLRAEQRATLAARQEPAVRLIAALQNMARRPPLLALVQPGSTRDLVRVRAMLAAMVPELRRRTASLRGEIERGKQLRADADRALLALGAGQARLGRERDRLAKIEAQHRATSEQFRGGALVEQDRAMALGEKARDVVDLMDRLGETAAISARLETLSGPLLRPQRPGDPRAAPLEGNAMPSGGFAYRLPVAGTVVTGLGEVSDAGVRARGLTIATRAGAQVIAPASGRIVFAAPYRGFGRIIIVDHGQGWTTLVTNLAALDARAGDIVDQGSPIGKAAGERPTVTVELRRGSVPVDIASIVR